jgi:hypothetical protein
VLESTGNPPSARLVSNEELAGVARGKDVAILTHGFNVDYTYGLQSLANLDQLLGLSPAIFHSGASD